MPLRHEKPSLSVRTTTPPLNPPRPVVNRPAGSNGSQEHNNMTEKVKALFKILENPEGEIPVSPGLLMTPSLQLTSQVFNKYDDSWKLIRSGLVAQKRDSGPWWNVFGSGISWTDTYGILLDDQCT
jgi:hypothetical protein